MKLPMSGNTETGQHFSVRLVLLFVVLFHVQVIRLRVSCTFHWLCTWSKVNQLIIKSMHDRVIISLRTCGGKLSHGEHGSQYVPESLLF